MSQITPNIIVTPKENPGGEKIIDVDAPNASIRLVLGTRGDTRISLSDKNYPSNCVKLQNYIQGQWRVTEEQNWQDKNTTQVKIEQHENGIFQGSVAGTPVFYSTLKENAFAYLQLLNAEGKTCATVDAKGKVTPQDPSVLLKEYGYTPQGYPFKPNDKPLGM